MICDILSAMIFPWICCVSLTHWGRETHICVSKLIIIGLNNGLSPDRRQAIIWTNDGSLLIGPLETNFSEILIAIQTFSLKKTRLKMSSAKWRPFCLGLNVLKRWNIISKQIVCIYSYETVNNCAVIKSDKSIMDLEKTWIIQSWQKKKIRW